MIKKRKVLLTSLLLAFSLNAFAQERCVTGATSIDAPGSNYEAGGGTTGSATMADGAVVNANNIAIGRANAAGAGNIAIGTLANAEGMQTVAVGDNSDATGDFSVAVGQGAQATRCLSVAVGDSAKASGRFATANGAGANASGAQSTASGAYSEASGHASSASGTQAKASGAYSTASGANSNASASYATSTGAGSNASGVAATATGGLSNASAANSTANGYNAQATHTNSVALGANSRTTRTNEVNVGGRQIGGVNDATLGTDAVNLRQMQAADAWTLSQANQYSDLGDVWTLNQAKHYTDEKVKGLHKRIDRMGAMSTAMSMMTSSAAAIPGKSKMAVGMGFTNGEPALAIGYQRAWLTKKNRPMSFTVGAAFARKERSVGAGLAWGLK